MSEHPTQHPTSEPIGFTQVDSKFWWTYNPNAKLGEGHGIGYFEGEWVTWRDHPVGNGDRVLKSLPKEAVPSWALSRAKHLL